jgi:thymidylate synthase (FAD)
LGGKLLDVLDHGFDNLVDHMGGDLSVCRAARVSFDAAWRAGKDKGSDEALINYLWRNHHSTPFEAVTFTFEVKAPIFVFRQWHRHRTQSYNELSARYKQLPTEFYVPDRVSGGQRQVIEGCCRNSFHVYKWLLDAHGVDKELARGVLPMNTYSHMFCTMNLLNLFKFFTLRCAENAQYEIRVYADAMLELVRPVVPVCVAAWEGK